MAELYLCNDFWCDSSDCGHYGKTVGKLCLHRDGRSVERWPVQMRKSPVNGEKITSLAAGTAVRVIDEADGSDGMKWYKVQISYNGMSSTGYIRSDFITLSSEDTSAGSTITDNSAQGAAGVVTNTNGNVYVRTGASTAYSPVTTG